MTDIKNKKTHKTAAKSSASPQKPTAQPKSASPKSPTIDKVSAPERAQAFIKMMNSNPKYRGKVQVRSARDYKTPYFLRRPTGLLGLDLALGGGFPAGGASQVYGTRSSGKTHMCYCVASQIQKNYGNDAIVVVATSEGRGDVGFMRMSGFCVAYSEQQIGEYDQIRTEELGLPPFTEEERADLLTQVGEVIFLGGNTGSDLLECTLVAADDLGSDCQLMIVDSMGSLLTPEQEEKGVGEKLYGGSSGIVTSWLTKMQPKFVNDRADGSLLQTTILGINQVRALIGGPIPNANRPAAGAKSWEHAQLVNVELKQGEPIWQDSKHAEQSGRVVKWNIRKGKAGTRDGAKGEFNWYYFKQDGGEVRNPVFWRDVQNGALIGGADKITDLVDVAKSTGIIEVSGAWRTVHAQNKQVLRTQGDEALVEKVANDPELEATLRDGCLMASGLTVRYR